VGVVRDDDRQVELARQGDGLGDEPVVVRQQVMRQLDVEAAWKLFRERSGGRPRPGAIPDPQPPGDLPIATAR
jgi:hypothetical protein